MVPGLLSTSVRMSSLMAVGGGSIVLRRSAEPPHDRVVLVDDLADDPLGRRSPAAPMDALDSPYFVDRSTNENGIAWIEGYTRRHGGYWARPNAQDHPRPEAVG